MSIASLKVIDTELALKRAGGNSDLAKELFSMLIKELPLFRNKIEESFAARSYSLLQESVHKLNGSATYCGVPALKSAVDALESRLKRGEYDSLLPGVSSVLEEIERVLSLTSPA